MEEDKTGKNDGAAVAHLLLNTQLIIMKCEILPFRIKMPPSSPSHSFPAS